MNRCSAFFRHSTCKNVVGSLFSHNTHLRFHTTNGYKFQDTRKAQLQAAVHTLQRPGV
jgi:hypothetical protein